MLYSRLMLCGTSKACREITKYNKYASYPDWRISPHVDRRHRPVCHIWLYEMCVTKTVHVLALGLTPGPKFTKRGDDLLPTQVYHPHPANFYHPASAHTRDIRYKNSGTNKHRNSKRYIPSMHIGVWR